MVIKCQAPPTYIYIVLLCMLAKAVFLTDEKTVTHPRKFFKTLSFRAIEEKIVVSRRALQGIHAFCKVVSMSVD